MLVGIVLRREPVVELSRQGDEDKAAGEGGEDQAPAKKKLSIVMLALIVAVPLLLIGGGAAAYFLFFAKSEDAAATAAKAEDAKPPKAMVFYNLPELLVNLNSQGRRSSFLKISLSFELADDGRVGNPHHQQQDHDQRDQTAEQGADRLEHPAKEFLHVAPPVPSLPRAASAARISAWRAPSIG